MESIPTRFEALVPTAGYIASGISKFLPASVTLEPAWEAFVSACDSLGALTAPWASASTVLRVPALESAVNDFAASVAQDPKTVRYLLCLIVAYPLALAFASLRWPAAKHAFSALVGVFLAQFVFGDAWVHSAFSATVAYLIMALTGPFRAFDGFRHNLVFGWMMLYMTAVHLHRLHHDYMGWSLDFTGPQMLLTIKLSALAYNLYDGSVMAGKYEQLIKAGHPMSKIFAERLRRGVSRLPNPLEYFGYVFCFTTFFAGPAFEYGEYVRSVAEAPFITGDGKKDRQWGSRVWAAVSKLVMGIAFLGLTVYGQANFPFTSITTEAMMYGPGMTLPYRGLHAFLCLFFTRCKYYFAWLVSEGSANLAGFGYQPESKAWNGARNIDVLGFELAGSVTEASRAWNMQTQSWLARYSNQRLPKGWNIWGTYMLSAVWHGFYPGYYLFFLSAPLLQALEKEFGAKVKPRVKSLGSVAAFAYESVSRVCTVLALNYYICPFVSLGWDSGILVWANFWFVGHIGTMVLLVLLAFVPAVKHHKHHAHKKE